MISCVIRGTIVYRSWFDTTCAGLLAKVWAQLEEVTHTVGLFTMAQELTYT